MTEHFTQAESKDPCITMRVSDWRNLLNAAAEKARAALLEELGKVEAVNAEPVAYIEYSHGTQYLVLANNLAGGRVTSRMRPLYTHPAPLRELSDDEIDAAWCSVDYTQPYDDFRIAVARAILKKAGEK